MTNKNISTDTLNTFRSDFGNSPHREVIKNAIIKNGLPAIAVNSKVMSGMQYTFSSEIETGKITAQKRSGRCWMFAGLNLFRHKVAENYKIKDFELSQNYLMFYDKLEKANFFLESILQTLDEDIYSRLLMWLLKDPVQDGGQWDMFTNLIRKYGAVPKYLMSETYSSSNSHMMNEILTSKLREYAAELRNQSKEAKTADQLREIKQQQLSEFYRLLVFFLGDPPEKFDFEYKDDEKVYHIDEGLTPVKFFDKYVSVNPDDYISLINAPTEDKPFNRTYTVDYLGNVIDGKKVLYLNIDIETLKEMTLKQLQNNEPVWFGCDVMKFMDKDSGIMDSRLFLYDEALETPFHFTKAERLLYGESLLTHAMVFTGVNLVNEKPTRWKVENSWGDEQGQKGFFVMSDKWFDEYNFQVIIQRKYLPEQLLNLFKEEPVVLPPWDPMGSVALMR